MTTKVFEDVSPAQVDALINELGANCTKQEDGSYFIKDQHIQASASYDEAKEELTVNLISKPFIISAEFVFTSLQKELDKK